MAVTYITPEGHVEVPIYHTVAVGTGSRHIHIAGQIAWNDKGELVAPGDLGGQIAQVYRNIANALEAAGGTFHDVVRITWFAAGWKREMYDVFEAAVNKASVDYDVPAPPLSLIGVEILFEPGILIEAEVTAIVE